MKKVVKIILASLVLAVVSFYGYKFASHKSTSQVAFDILSSYKKIKGDGVDKKAIAPSALKSIDHSEWSALCDKFVRRDGRVDYKGLAKNRQRLDQYLNYISVNAPASNWTKEERLSYWINAYNAFTVKLILDHPKVSSIKDIADGLPMIDSPWDIKFFKIGGVDFDLNTIEHDILRKEFDEPRIHFAINCASVSCPKLRHEAYLPKYLEFQLDDQARLFINNTSKNVIGKEEMKVSKIFEWFQSDFTQDGSLHSYIQKYNPEVDPDVKISYLPYDWSLNK